VRIECRHELSIQSEAACGTLIEAANQQFGFRLEYRNTQVGNTGGVAVAKRHVSNCACIRICHCIARGLVNDAEVAVTMRQRVPQYEERQNLVPAKVSRLFSDWVFVSDAKLL
jgi:hypothetical protein